CPFSGSKNRAPLHSVEVLMIGFHAGRGVVAAPLIVRPRVPRMGLLALTALTNLF
ncbi:MAG: hypothetical protein ACI9GB_003825, partial [Halioglobus sp.]